MCAHMRVCVHTYFLLFFPPHLPSKMTILGTEHFYFVLLCFHFTSYLSLFWHKDDFKTQILIVSFTPVCGYFDNAVLTEMYE